MTLAVATGNLIVGVYLYAEVLAGINELDEQRELIAEVVVVLLTHEYFLLFLHQLVQALAFVRAIGHDGLAAADT